MRLARWFTGLAVIAIAGTSVLWLARSGEVNQLRRERAELERERIELKHAIQRLTGEDRVAEVYVIDQIKPGHILNGQPARHPLTTIEFIELDRQQHPLPSQRFIINDDVIFFDALVLKFDPEHVAAGDELRGKSLALFRRIYGEHQNPADGFPIDRNGDVPNIFRINPEPNEFELKLWNRFWDYAADPDLAAKEGIRVAQGEAVYVPMQPGQVWTLTMQNSGGLSIKLRRHHADGTTRPAVAPRNGA